MTHKPLHTDKELADGRLERMTRLVLEKAELRTERDRLMAEVERLRKEYAILEAQHQRVSAQADDLLAIAERLQRENERLRTALAITDEMAPSHTNITRAAE